MGEKTFQRFNVKASQRLQTENHYTQLKALPRLNVSALER